MTQEELIAEIDSDPFLSIKDLCKKINSTKGFSNPNVYRSIFEEKILKAVRIGRILFTRESWVDEWLSQNTARKRAALEEFDASMRESI